MAGSDLDEPWRLNRLAATIAKLRPLLERTGYRLTVEGCQLQVDIESVMGRRMLEGNPPMVLIHCTDPADREEKLFCATIETVEEWARLR